MGKQFIVLWWVFKIILFANSQDVQNVTAVADSAQNETTSDRICRACVCKDGKVDCHDKDISTFFKKSDWAGVMDFKPIKVDLSNNHITNITGIIVELPIEILNFSYCNIEFIEKFAFRELQQMRVLDLSWNQLTSETLNPDVFVGRYAPERYEPLSGMRVLNLAHNRLRSLDQDLFEHTSDLTDLNLSGNPIVSIDHPTLIAISSLPMLKVLKMHSCQLTDIPDKFLHTPSHLEYLDLSNNSLEIVPQEIEETKNLIFLNLNNNPIYKLEKDSNYYPGFPKLIKLQELHMCEMSKLVYIGEGTLSGLENLRSLHLGNNRKLATVHPRAMARRDDVGETLVWPPLRELYLTNSNVTEIDSRLVSRWDLLVSMDVTRNPYLCDCSTQWMVDHLVEVAERLQDNSSAKMVCQEPIEMRGLTMKHLHDIHRRMRCVDKYGNRPERDGAILLGTLIGVLLAVPILLTIILLWRRGVFSVCGARGPTHFSSAFYKKARSDEFE